MKFKEFGYIALMCLCSCTGTVEKSNTLAVSIEPQRKLLEEIAGDKYEVVTVMANGANPETYDPSVSQRLAVNNSVAYFVTGVLPFENAIAANTEDTKIYNTSEGIEPITGTHSHGHGETADDTDPHVWTSIRNAKIMAKNMADQLTELDPTHSTYYQERYQTLKARLDSLDDDTARRLANSDAHAFLVWHPSLSYFARDYGLHQISVGQESKEQSVSNLQEIINEAREDSVRVFFFQREYDSRQAESLNKEIGTRLVTIDPLAYDWEDQLISITDELTK